MYGYRGPCTAEVCTRLRCTRLRWYPAFMARPCFMLNSNPTFLALVPFRQYYQSDTLYALLVTDTMSASEAGYVREATYQGTTQGVLPGYY